MSAFKSVRQLCGIFLQYRNILSESFGARQRSLAFIPVYVLFIIVRTTKGINSFQLLKFKSFKLIIVYSLFFALSCTLQVNIACKMLIFSLMLLDKLRNYRSPTTSKYIGLLSLISRNIKYILI